MTVRGKAAVVRESITTTSTIRLSDLPHVPGLDLIVPGARPVATRREGAGVITLPRLMLAALLLVGGYTFVVAPRVAAETGPAVRWETKRTEPRPTFTPGPTPRRPTAFPPAGKAFFGVFTSRGPADLTEYDGFVAAAGKQPQVMMFAQGWAVAKTFDRQPFDRIMNRGMLPMLGWEPWNFRSESKQDKQRGNQPEYQLSKIIRGDHDAYVKAWAAGVKSLGYPVAIRFAHEMNGYWYPWCESANGNRRATTSPRGGTCTTCSAPPAPTTSSGCGARTSPTTARPRCSSSTPATTTSTGSACPATTAPAASSSTRPSTRSTARPSTRSGPSANGRSSSPRSPPPTPPAAKRSGSPTCSRPCRSTRRSSGSSGTNRSRKPTGASRRPPRPRRRSPPASRSRTSPPPTRPTCVPRTAARSTP